VIECFLEKTFGEESGNESVAYFYCSKRKGSGSSVVDVFRSLVRQLAYSSKDARVDNDVVDAFKSRTSPETDPLMLKECKQLLPRLLCRSTSAALIIDALDECSKPQQLLSELTELSAVLSECSVRLFMSSRDDVNVSRFFPTCESVSITPKSVADDFKYFVNRHVEVQSGRGHELGEEENAALRERLISVVTEQGQGG
jgi:hypothetical protein